MRIALAAGLLTGVLFAGLSIPQHLRAAPAAGLVLQPNGEAKFQRVEDTCWWWGTRWQYGWRGYGWYPCWDWVKPQPTVVAPERVPSDALSPRHCMRKWRDPAGNWHTRRVC